MSTEEKLDALPRLRLCQLPTPIARARRAERELGLAAGPEIWIKRDDLTGLAFGGNKGRKLEFCLAEAQQAGCDVVLQKPCPPDEVHTVILKLLAAAMENRAASHQG